LSAAIRWSRRLPWEHPTNRLARAVEERTARGLPTIDLTETNPMRVGIPYPEEELRELLRRGAAEAYEPHPRGLLSAREALAANLSSPGDPVSPEDLILTASTSEAYSYLFKLFGEPGEEVLTTAPSYPLLDSLATLEGLRLSHVHLSPGRRFALNLERLELCATPDTCLLALVHPGNPTGVFLSESEQAGVAALCASRGLPLISDEVFADYPLGEAPRAGPMAASSDDALAFSLGGLSKSAGLPSWKLGWIRIGGPASLRRRALAALELVADSYLSVGTPVQRALPGALQLAPRIRSSILARLRENLATVRGLSGIELFEPAGGWSAVLRFSHPGSDEDLALEILDCEGVLVHPGYFFDFATDDFLVLSLLPEPSRFEEGVGRITSFLTGAGQVPLPGAAPAGAAVRRLSHPPRP